ncbi:hypothetical protein [Paraflavitalea pollutisoli]|nr:hypothetical protein [Paraflavitalea sp. H1-2-19X]
MIKNPIIRVIVLVIAAAAALYLLYHCAGGFKMGMDDAKKFSR